MSDLSWGRFKQAIGVVMAMIPLVGSVVVVYSGIEVMKTQVGNLADDVSLMRGDFNTFHAEVRDDIKDLRSEIRDVRNGKGP